MTERDRSRLLGVHPALVEAIGDVLDQMEAWGHPMFVVEGVRTQARQQELYAQGRTTSGPIVTYDDGLDHKSHHQVHADGFGYAVDCAFLDGNPYAQSHPWDVYMHHVEDHGLIAGGRWKMMDLPHAELPDQGLLKTT
jgi:peptidoglycan L-alanyl-D-glutamate endopeptidase CwlK